MYYKHKSGFHSEEPLLVDVALLYILDLLLLALPKFRAYIALASAAVFVILGILPINKVFYPLTGM